MLLHCFQVQSHHFVAISHATKLVAHLQYYITRGHDLKLTAEVFLLEGY